MARTDRTSGGEPRAGDVLVVGDLMVDVVTTHDTPIGRDTDTPARIEVVGGGSAANTAAWLGHLGASVRLVAALGTDALGDRAVAELEATGARFGGVRLDDHATGTCVVLVGPDRERTMLPDRGANDRLPAGAVEDAFAAPTSWVHLSGYVLLGEGSRSAGVLALAMARGRGCPCSVDAASSGPIATVGVDRFLELVDGCDLLLANDDEVAALGGADAVLDHVRAVVTKHGADGATWTDGVRRVTAAGVAVDAVDTTGAGDAFAAGWVAAAVAGGGVDDALASAVATGARAVVRPGARPPVARP